MSRFRRSGSITRYFVEGEGADVSDVSLIKSLERERFKPLENSATETESIGWVTRESPGGSRFAVEDVIHGHFLIFTMRHDRKRVSPTLLKIQIAGDLRAAATGRAEGKQMPRAQKKQIIEEAKRKLTSRALPTVALTDVVWNCENSELYVFATGAAVVEQAALLFRETFKRDLEPASITAISNRYKWNDAQKRALAELSPFDLKTSARGGVASPVGADAEAEE
ncbi:MAG: recombination-associated protein RdgC [Planctomycetes bacterium]|nr:recombination-associated protein RdgC [Planctomycetota bacterium]